MFWGLIMEPNKRYSQTVEKSFHVSMATLDVTNADDNVVQVTVCYEDTNYLLCSLKKGSVWQVPLDLHFQEGTEVAFTCNGRSPVHLTGYLIPEDDADLMDELEEEEEEEDDEKVPQLVDKQSKRKAIDIPKGNRKVKRVKHEAESSDEDDADLDGTNDDVEDSDEDDEEEEMDESLLNEENDSEDEDEDDDEDDDNDDDDDEEEEEEKIQIKPNKQQQQQQQQQQGKKNKQAQQQQEQQQKKKQDNQKLVNGKVVKQDQQNNKQQKKNKGEQQQQQQQNAQNEQKKRVIEGGVQIRDLKTGNGAPAKAGRFVSVYYVGRLQNGKKFDATTQGDGFKFRLGKGEVIKGWDVGITGMKVGGKRQITIPPSMAYGAKGSPPAIPGNSTLVFDVELKNVH